MPDCSDGKPRGTASSRGSIFTVLVSVLTLNVSVSVLILCLQTRDSSNSRYLLKSASNVLTHQKPSWQSTWQWSILRTLTQMNTQPFIPSHNSTVCNTLCNNFQLCLRDITALAAEPIEQRRQLPAHFLVLMGKLYWLPYHFLLLHNGKKCICSAQKQAKSVVTGYILRPRKFIKMHLRLHSGAYSAPQIP